MVSLIGKAKIDQSVSVLSRAEGIVHARGMRHGAESVRNHTHIHNATDMLSVYIL